ncbi:peptidoglycan-binding protein [Methylocystis sp. WRRC1]|uniref:peptidoglycan-binding domain-containing protein n=1 Tax=Methylocystis sp. WRRC1 TaxID=1732014 RepID=UPI001D13F8B7|nr:peptidoglycan-binding domain-containing protein [Methylocystis sp. WRRC1]MCC3247005.1 peptidoglycan-binding protein [Methylocystis sp. WRRC1]
MRDASLSASGRQSLPEERSAPRRRASAKRADKNRPSVLSRVFGLKRMSVLLLLGIGGLAAVGVPMNALFFQDGRHPAPLFSTHLPVAEKTETAAAPKPPVRPTEIAATRAEAEAAKPESPRPPAKVERTRTDAAKPEKAEVAKTEVSKTTTEKKRDPISQLLGGAAEKEAEAGPDKNVLYAQRALLKLGYVVRADGVFGGTTRQAIEKFERDSGLPVKGQLSPKVMRQLATRSGLAHQ